MPYARRKGGPRKKRMSFKRKRNSWSRYGAKAGSLAYKAYKGVRWIQRLINVEKKFFDIVSAPTVSTTPSIISLSNIAQGNDYNQRDGNSILIQSMLLRALITLNSMAATSIIRLVLFVDNDQRGTDPAATDLFESVGSLTTPLNHNVASRFNVLMDKFVSLSINGNRSMTFKRFFKYNRHIKYTGTTGADATAYEGAIFLLLWSSEVTNVPTVDYSFRLRYTDN